MCSCTDRCMRIQGKETRTVRGSHTELKRDLRAVLFTILLIKINVSSQMLHFFTVVYTVRLHAEEQISL